MTDWGDVFRRHRRRLGLSQRSFGYLVGVPQHKVSAWELGKVEMRLSTAIRLANLSNLDIQALVRVDAEGAPEPTDMGARHRKGVRSLAVARAHTAARKQAVRMLVEKYQAAYDRTYRSVFRQLMAEYDEKVKEEVDGA